MHAFVINAVAECVAFVDRFSVGVVVANTIHVTISVTGGNTINVTIVNADVIAS